MRKLKLMAHISLDGVIQSSPEDNFNYGDWTAPYRNPAGLAIVLEEQGDKFDLLMGRKTYDMWSLYWPKMPSSAMSDRLNAAKKYIITHRPESLEWGPFEAVTGDVVKSIRDIKSKDGLNLVMWGSSTLTSLVIEQGLADEVILMVYPVLIGKGKRFFAEGTPPRSFNFERSRVLPSGIIVNNYKFAGPLQNLK